MAQSQPAPLAPKPPLQIRVLLRTLFWTLLFQLVSAALPVPLVPPVQPVQLAQLANAAPPVPLVQLAPLELLVQLAQPELLLL